MKLAEITQREVVTLDPQASLDMAIAKMSQLGVRHLPVARDGALMGMISDRDILLHAFNDTASGASIGDRQVEQLMSRPLVSRSAQDSAVDAAKQMLDG